MKEDYKLAQWLNNEMSEEELIEFQSTSEYAIYEKIKDYSAQLKAPEFDEETAIHSILSSKKEEVKVVNLKSNWLVRIAAILVIGLGLFFSFKNFTNFTEVAENGKNTSFILPDKSEVVLNSGSEIEYKKWNWENERKLDLAGEAYFKVAKGKKFEVNTDLGKVTVLGTQFNVKARKNRFDVICYEGHVKVNYNNKTHYLTQGQSVTYENNQKIINNQNSATKPYWISGELAFEQESLVSVLEEMQRKYNITFDSTSFTTDQLFTGKIPSNNLDLALKIIVSSYHLETEKTNTKIILKQVDDKK